MAQYYGCPPYARQMSTCNECLIQERNMSHDEENHEENEENATLKMNINL